MIMGKYFSSENFLRKGTAILTFILLFGFFKASGYGVLTHEAIIDAAWDGNVVPLLKKKFPDATREDLIKAHAYAYGGAIMPDMGYFPFGNIFFTELLHYVRSGDFIMNLLSEAKDLNEYAFALGAVAHYIADKDGHPGAVNLAVSMVYPDVQKEFGDTVSYAEDPIAHRRMEFGFDVLQVARGKYAPKSYHDFIGFEVALPLLERTFLLTYGLQMKDVYTDIPLAINTFRWSVKTFMPELTNAAWISRKKEIENSQPGITRRQFNYSMKQAHYHKEWGKNYQKPKFGSYIEAWVIRIFPKIGVTRILKFKPPTQPAEVLFIKSFNRTLSDYSMALKKCETNALHLGNINFDTGKKIAPCEYTLVDDTYKQLLLQISSQPIGKVSDQLRKNILDFYKTFAPDVKNKTEDQKCFDAISMLKSIDN
jgi:hypothetical protein